MDNNNNRYVEPDLTIDKPKEYVKCCVVKPRFVINNCGNSDCFGFINYWNKNTKNDVIKIL
jgi:hypothetical protein